MLQIRVIPNARKHEVVGVYGEGIKIKLQAPPVDGKANEALIAFLAGKLGCHANRIRVVSGEKGRTKLLEILELDETSAREKLLGGIG